MSWKSWASDSEGVADTVEDGVAVGVEDGVEDTGRVLPFLQIEANGMLHSASSH